MRVPSSLTAAALILLSGVAGAASINVSLGKTVTATGAVGVLSPDGIAYPWCPDADCPAAALSTLTDGVYLANGTAWQAGTIWWDERHPGSANNVLEIDLGGRFLIDFLAIQFDNNDFYDIQIRDWAGNWSAFVTAEPTPDPGMATRSGPFVPFEATAFRIDARGGDQYYALSEFQANGVQIPEPGSLALLGLGTVAAAFAGRARRRTRS
jgi:hypothetical protein